jgi:hypothetical protein
MVSKGIILGNLGQESQTWVEEEFMPEGPSFSGEIVK